MDYTTVFDVRGSGCECWIYLAGVIFGGLFVVLGWATKTLDQPGSREKGAFFQVGGALGAVGACAFFVASYVDYRTFSRALSAQDFSIVQGIVTDFTPMTQLGHGTESFTINGVHFKYGSGFGATAFNSDSNKGFLRKGVKARISYRGEDILKVEIKSPQTVNGAVSKQW